MAGGNTSSLQTYNAIAAEFGITEDLNIPMVARLSFARSQAEQMQQIVNRLVFDLTMTTVRMDGAKDEDTKAAYKGKMSEYSRDLRQTRDGLKTANELVKELEAEIAD